MYQVIEHDGSEVLVETPKGRMSSSTDSSSSRTVYLFDDFVIKFERRGQNAKELFFYQNVLEEKDAKFFPKLLGSGYYEGELFLIQERAKPIDKKWASRKQARQYQYLTAKYRLSDLTLIERKKTPYGRKYCDHFNLYITGTGLKIYDIGIFYADGTSDFNSGYGSSYCSCSDCCPRYCDDCGERFSDCDC